MKIKIKITNEDSKYMRNAFKEAIDEIEQVLNRKKPITDITKLAANTVSNYSRVKTTEVHDKALEIMLARKDITATLLLGDGEDNGTIP